MREIFIYLMSFLLVACGQSYEEKKRLSREEQARLRKSDSLALKVAVMPTLDCLPMFVAKEKRLFDTLNVDVRLRMYNAQMDCDEAVSRGIVEGSVSDLVRAERMMNKGIRLRYVTSTNAYWQLIANNKTRIKEISQLGDKMIAMTRYSATDYLSNLAIDSVKTKNPIFKVQINDVGIRLHMLLNNEMDAMMLPEPQATTARMHKNPVLMDSRDKDLKFGVIVFRTEKIVENRRSEQLERYIKAYNAACDSINRYGLQHYGSIIMKYCACDSKTIKNLPKLKYEHAAQPRQKDIINARNKKYNI